MNHQNILKVVYRKGSLGIESKIILLFKIKICMTFTGLSLLIWYPPKNNSFKNYFIFWKTH